MGRPDDPVAQENAMTAAELKHAAAAVRAALLAGAGNAEDVVRLENAANRAEGRLQQPYLAYLRTKFGEIYLPSSQRQSNHA
jgi:hypothetical protein